MQSPTTTANAGPMRAANIVGLSSKARTQMTAYTAVKAPKPSRQRFKTVCRRENPSTSASKVTAD